MVGKSVEYVLKNIDELKIQIIIKFWLHFLDLIVLYYINFEKYIKIITC